MTWMRAIAGGVVPLGVGAGIVAWRFLPFYAPYAWTQEPQRLAAALALREGMTVADIGAGDGALAVAMSGVVGESGLVYATELAPDRLRAIEDRVRREARRNVRVLPGAETATRLPRACCDAIYLRTVAHHVGALPAFAADVSAGLREAGRVGVIDFAPGALWFHGRDHGITPEQVVTAFQSAGLRLVSRDDRWGGGLFLLVFARGPV